MIRLIVEQVKAWHTRFYLKKLNVWVAFKEVTKLIHVITKEFPDEKSLGYRVNLKSALVSIASNLAKGIARITIKR